MSGASAPCGTDRDVAVQSESGLPPYSTRCTIGVARFDAEFLDLLWVVHESSWFIRVRHAALQQVEGFQALR